MSLSTVRALRVLCTIAAAALLGGVARADLVWSPDSGWRIEGGVLTGLTGSQGQEALKLMNKARAAEERGANGSAISAYTKVTKRYATSVYAPEAFYHIGLIRWRRHQLYKAFENLEAILARYPNVRRFNDIVGDEYRISAALLNGQRNHAWGWFPGLPNRLRGVQYMEFILAAAPYSDYAPLCLMEIARGHEYLGNNDEAIDALDRLVNTYSNSVISPDAYLRLARLHSAEVEGPYYDQAETRQSITYSQDFMILFPSDKRIGDAASELDRMKRTLAESKVKIGDFYFYKRDNYTAARVFYNEAITSYPDSEVARLARQRLTAVEVKANAAAQGAPKKKHFLFF